MAKNNKCPARHFNCLGTGPNCQPRFTAPPTPFSAPAGTQTLTAEPAQGSVDLETAFRAFTTRDSASHTRLILRTPEPGTWISYAPFPTLNAVVTNDEVMVQYDYVDHYDPWDETLERTETADIFLRAESATSITHHPDGTKETLYTFQSVTDNAGRMLAYRVLESPVPDEPAQMAMGYTGDVTRYLDGVGHEFVPDEETSKDIVGDYLNDPYASPLDNVFTGDIDSHEMPVVIHKPGSEHEVVGVHIRVTGEPFDSIELQQPDYDD